MDYDWRDDGLKSYTLACELIGQQLIRQRIIAALKFRAGSMTTFLDGKVSLMRGDCLELLPTLEAESIDSCVTDPPYHLTSIVKRFGNENSAPINNADEKLGRNGPYHRASKGFMGKQWDGGDIALRPEVWAEVLRVLKPGAHLLAFSGTRTYHRMACAIEDAGFEIRDQIGWCYGSGFPKSHDVSKGIDRLAGAERNVVGRSHDKKYTANGITSGASIGGQQGGHNYRSEFDLTSPATESAIQWQGWGTALKPAWEPIVLARKPLSESSIAANVLKHGTGGINVDGCRVQHSEECKTMRPQNHRAKEDRIIQQAGRWKDVQELKPEGRWPANLIHDGSEEVLKGFPDSEVSGSARNGRLARPNIERRGVTDFDAVKGNGQLHNDSGSAARFFYTAKADQDDRLGSKHPTVKPVDLIQYLVRLITPSGGLCLDPFAGTGTTGEAAFRESMQCILIEREPEYQADIERRMALVLAGPDERTRETIKARGLVEEAGPLFGGKHGGAA